MTFSDVFKTAPRNPNVVLILPIEIERGPAAEGEALTDFACDAGPPELPTPSSSLSSSRRRLFVADHSLTATRPDAGPKRPRSFIKLSAAIALGAPDPKARGQDRLSRLSAK